MSERNELTFISLEKLGDIVRKTPADTTNGNAANTKIQAGLVVASSMPPRSAPTAPTAL
jgi:hypothetical protein